MTFLWGLVGTPMAIALAEKFRLLDVPEEGKNTAA